RVQQLGSNASFSARRRPWTRLGHHAVRLAVGVQALWKYDDGALGCRCIHHHLFGLWELGRPYSGPVCGPVNAMEDRDGAVECLAQLLGIGGIDAHPFNEGMVRAAARPSQNANVFPPLSELFGDGPTNGSCSGDDVHADLFPRSSVNGSESTAL